MKKIVLDGRTMTNRQAAHRQIKTAMAFPDYYGDNLDALWDMLTDICAPTEVQLTHAVQMKAQLGEYGKKLIDTFEEAAAENKDFKFQIEDKQ